MCRSLIAVLAVVGLIGWQWQRVGVSNEIRPVRSAYDTAVNRHHGAESLRRAISPRQALSWTDAGYTVGADTAGLEQGSRHVADAETT